MNLSIVNNIVWYYILITELKIYCCRYLTSELGLIEYYILIYYSSDLKWHIKLIKYWQFIKHHNFHS